jgi:hypothetical protein
MIDIQHATKVDWLVQDSYPSVRKDTGRGVPDLGQDFNSQTPVPQVIFTHT